jgi:putative Mn2+ efflux pump MntP
MGWRRLFNRHLRFGALVVAMLLVYSTVTVIVDDYTRVLAITAGLLILIVGIWYASNPFLTSERRYIQLREEVQQFIQLSRRLNRVATSEGSGEEIQRVKSEMHDAVERIGAAAGKL